MTASEVLNTEVADKPPGGPRLRSASLGMTEPKVISCFSPARASLYESNSHGASPHGQIRVNPFTFFWNTSIGKKWLVALTGLVLIGYVIGHMVGNLQIFAGPEQINAYAGLLHSMPNTLWVVRIFLLAAFVLHIVTTIRLVAENRAAKGQKYEQRKSVQAKLATKTMALSGLLVLAFVGLHLADFTIRSTDARYHHLPKGEYDVHTMVIWHFQNPVFTGIYIVAIFLLCMHLSHGFQSLLQTLGANSGKVRLGVSRAGQVLAWLIFLGYISIPVAVMANILKVAP